MSDCLFEIIYEQQLEESKRESYDNMFSKEKEKNSNEN